MNRPEDAPLSRGFILWTAVVFSVSVSARWEHAYADGGTATPPAAPSSQANDQLTEQFGPFKFSIGQDSASGGFGANLNGDGRLKLGSLNGSNQPEGVERLWTFLFGSMLYSATGTWGSAQNATNNASLSAKPGVDGLLAYGKFLDPLKTASPEHPIKCDQTGENCTQDGHKVPLAEYPTEYLGFGIAGDLELRYGAFKQSSGVVDARELLVGGQAYTVILLHDRAASGFAHILADPHFAISYYHPTTATATTDVALPSGAKANYLETSAETVLGFGGTHTSAVKLDLKFEGSKPTSGVSGGQSTGWQHLWTVKLWVPGLKFNGVSPSVSYQSGTKGGFTYDKQVLLGVLMEFLDPGKAKN